MPGGGQIGGETGRSTSTNVCHDSFQIENIPGKYMPWPGAVLYFVINKNWSGGGLGYENKRQNSARIAVVCILSISRAGGVRGTDGRATGAGTHPIPRRVAGLVPQFDKR